MAPVRETVNFKSFPAASVKYVPEESRRPTVKTPPVIVVTRLTRMAMP